MDVSENDARMEGWLYLFRSNRIGLQYSRKRYYVLQNHLLKCFKSVSHSRNKDPIRSAVIDSCIRVTDDGRESVHRKVFFIFTLYNTSNHRDQVKLGASSPEEAARWIHSFQEAAQKEEVDPEYIVDCPKNERPYLRLNCSSRVHSTKYLDWTVCSASITDPTTADVVAPPSPWTIFGCQNGLRLFKEARDSECHEKKWDNTPEIMAVSGVDGTSEAIFQTLMSLGSSRSEWDFCFYKGSVIEHLDGHTDIVHKILNGDWLDWGMKQRDLLLRRYWRREDDGTYIVLYHSVFHKKCPPQKGYVRACLKSGGYVVSPLNQGKQSVVKHMLAMDWKSWKSYLQESSARSITIRMLGRLAALRELFRANLGDYSSSEFSSGELMEDGRLHENEDAMNVQAQINENGEARDDMEDIVSKTPSYHSPLAGLDDGADEFFDACEPQDDQTENVWPSDFGSEMHSRNIGHVKVSTAADFVKKLHDFAGQKSGYTEQEIVQEDCVSCNYGGSLLKDPTSHFPSSWTTADASIFQIRGVTFFKDRKKVMAKGTLMQMVGADCLRSDKREHDLAGRPGSIVQKYAANGGPEFFFIVNMQVPSGSTTYHLAFYYMMSTPVEDVPLLDSFIRGDDAHRNSRFKLIPYVSKGPWIVKQSVGNRPGMVCQMLKTNYVRGKNYLELDIDVGSSAIARGVAGLVFSYFSNMIIEMAILIQANTAEELPEQLLGTTRLAYLDISKAGWVKQ